MMKRVLFLVWIPGLFILNACQQPPSEKFVRYQENYEIIGEERDELIGEVSDTIYETIDRSNSKAEELIIGPIPREGEKVILPEGRYQIGGEISGTVYVYDADEVLLTHEVLDQYGVGNITIDVNGDHTITVDGITTAHIFPVETKLSNELGAGIWEVGKDIEAGIYKIYGPGFGFGYIQQFEQGKEPRVFEIVGDTRKNPLELHLQEGQKLKISGISAVQFSQ